MKMLKDYGLAEYMHEHFEENYMRLVLDNILTEDTPNQSKAEISSNYNIRQDLPIIQPRAMHLSGLVEGYFGNGKGFVIPIRGKILNSTIK